MASQLHNLVQMKRFFSQWFGLYKSYSGYETLTFEKKPLPLKVIHLFKARVFRRFKMFATMRKSVKNIISTQKHKHNALLVKEVFFALRRHKNRSKMESSIVKTITDKQEKKMSKRFFKGMIRACMIR